MHLMKSFCTHLFPLLRLSLGTSSDAGGLSAISKADWESLVNLSFEQGVAAIAVDGLQKYCEQHPEVELALYSPELEALKYEWFGSVFTVEQGYSNISSVVRQLSKGLNDSGVKALIVKGLSYASYYPIPEHRTFGDIDIFSPDSYDSVNEVLRPISEGFNLDYYRHSHCSVSGVKIENHKHLCDVRGQKRWQLLEPEFARYAEETLAVEKEGGLYFPDSRLSILFFLYHAQNHFVFESISLRFLTDWAMILQKEKELLSSAWFSESIERFGLTKFAAVLTSLCVEHLGVEKEQLPDCLQRLVDKVDKAIADKVLEDIFRKDGVGSINTTFASRMKLALSIFRKGWKYREFLGVGPFAFVLEKWCGIVNEKVLKLGI